MKRSFQLSGALVLLPFIALNAQNAPVTSAGNRITLDTSVTVPVTASAFNDIGSCSLELLYDPGIATARAVTAGPLLGGNLNSNLTIPGKIILGWYAVPGVTLPDGTVILNIEFSRVSKGTSPLTWFDDGYSCYYANGNAVILNDLPTSSYYLNGSVTFTSKAPVTMAPSLRAGPGALPDIPVRVSSFRDIGKFSLTLQYDPSVLTFQSATNNPGFQGLTVHESAPGTLLAGWTADSAGPAMSLNDSSVIFTLHCRFSGGSTLLKWKVDGGSCAYDGMPPSYTVLYDVPKEAYYLDGSVTQDLGIGEPAKIGRAHV
jgi:hypothetical protein